MWPYYVMLAVPASIAMIDYARNKRNSYKGIITSFFAIFLLLLMLRSFDVGIDVRAYDFLYQVARKHTWSYAFSHAFSMDYESGYYFLSKIVGIFTKDYRWLMILMAIASLVPIWWLYRETIRDHMFLAIVIFLNIGIFAIYFSALRQVLAMAFIVPAYYFTKNRKPLLFLLMVLPAFLFHYTALVILLMYPVYHIRMQWYHSLVAAAVIFPIVFVFRESIFRFIISVFSSLYDTEVVYTSAVSVLLLLLVFIVFSFVIPDNDAMDSDSIGLRNLLVLAGFLQIFAGVNPLAMRLNYYFLLFVPIVITRVIDYTHPKNEKVTVFVLLMMLGFFTVYYLYDASTGVSGMHIYPYIPFWRQA